MKSIFTSVLVCLGDRSKKREKGKMILMSKTTFAHLNDFCNKLVNGFHFQLTWLLKSNTKAIQPQI